MGRQAVIQITCDRCTRVEHRPITKEEQELGKKTADFVGMFLGQRLEFQDLCTPCQDIVRGHWAQINKELTKASPQRPKKSPG